MEGRLFLVQIAKENEKLLRFAWGRKWRRAGDVVGIYGQVGVDFGSIVGGEKVRRSCQISGIVLVGTAVRDKLVLVKYRPV